jgi:hypothetical protein
MKIAFHSVAMIVFHSEVLNAILSMMIIGFHSVLSYCSIIATWVKPDLQLNK